MDQTILLMKESFPLIKKKNFTHQPLLMEGVAYVTGDCMETSTAPQ